MGFPRQDDVKIVLLNLYPIAATHDSFVSLVGDAKNMKEFEDESFDVVFSNSVIEHVGGFEQQRQMANEVRRVGKRIFLQTPNRYFPIEPHFLFPLFQFLPTRFQVYIIQHFSPGWLGKAADREQANKIVSSIRLLTKKELGILFPGVSIHQEKAFGLAKSFVVEKR
jgi:ubiquinone/menaquinone biosynthesis C-methylase UbiE